jgi:hypothetical protein
MGFRSDFNTIHFHETFDQSNQASQVKTFRVEHSGAGSVVDDAIC